MLSLSEQHVRTLRRMRRRLVFRDFLAWLGVGFSLSFCWVAWLLLAPDFWAGRRVYFAFTLMLVLLLPAALGALWPWYRRGTSSQLVELLAERQVIDAAMASGLQLALGRVASGSSGAVALAMQPLKAQLDALDLERVQMVPKPLRQIIGVMVVLAGLGIAVWGQGRWDAAQDAWSTSAQAAATQRGMARISDLTVVLNYPDYLERDPERLEGSDGSLEVPEGTRVALQARLPQGENPESAAVLVDGLRVAFTVGSKGRLSGEFLARRSGLYRLALVINGEEIVEREGHDLVVIEDRKPEVVRRFPEEPLELDEAKVVEFLFEGSDDHGVSKAEVVYRTEGDEDERRLPVELGRLGAQVRQAGELDLSALGVGPGDTLHWVIEVQDNNNVTGPSQGRCRWHRIHIFDPNKRLDELLETLDRFVGSLADRLAPLLTRAEAREPWSKEMNKVLLKGDALVEQMSDKRLKAQGMRSSLKTALKRLRDTAGQYARGFVNEGRMEDRLERDMLYLDDLLSKRRLEQLTHLQEELKQERRALERMVQKYGEAKDDEGLKQQILASIRAVRRRLDDLRKKMARLERRVGREYVNKDAYEQRSVGGELDKLEAMVRAGRMEEALAALDAMNQALGKVDKQVAKASERFGSKEWREAYAKGQQIQEQLRWIKDRQERLRSGVENLRRTARNRHLKQFGSLKKLRQKLQRLLAEGRGELAQITELEDWLQSRVNGLSDRLNRADKALAADGYNEALEELRRTLGRLESLGWMLNEPGAARQAAQARQRKALERVGQAVKLLERLFPEGSDGLSRREQARLRQGVGQQNEVSERLKKMRKMMEDLNEMAPVVGGKAMDSLGQAERASQVASGMMEGADAAGAGRAQADVLAAIEALKKQMNQGGGQGGKGGMPMPWGGNPGSNPQGDKPGGKKNSRRGDRVKIPESQAGVPGAWREEIIEAWGEGFAGPGEKAVDRYYRELVR